MIVRIASTFMSGVANSKETSGMAHGAIWGFVQIAAQKLAGAFTYLVLAWLLTPSEIGLGTLSITLVAAATFIYPARRLTRSWNLSAQAVLQLEQPTCLR